MQMTSEGQMALSRATRASTAPQKGRQGVPAFLQKLYEMLNNPSSSDLIRWAEPGDSFFVLDHERFAREVLPRWFKHQNFASFVRQLNMYGFHKIPHLQQGVLRSDTGENEYWNFGHDNFRRDQPDLLCLIQRKKGPSNAQQQPPEEGVLDVRDLNIPTPQPTTTPIAPHVLAIQGPGPGQVLDVNSILQGIAAIKKHQTTISEELQQLKHSNQLLWQESMTARERLQKNEDTVQRIVKFLAGVFGSRRAEGAHSGHHEHAHTGHGGREGKGGAEGTDEGAVVPVQRRSSGTPGAGIGAGGPRPMLMIEGAKDTSGKGTSNVGIVEVGEDEADDVVNIIIEDDDEHVNNDDEDDRNTEMADFNISGSGPLDNNNYAVETPVSIPSPSPSIAQSDTAAPTIAEASLSPSSTTSPSLNFGSSGPHDAVMHERSFTNTDTNTNSTSTVIDRAITPSSLTAPSPPPSLQLQSALNTLTPEQLSFLLSFLSQSDASLPSSSIDPNLGFPPPHPDDPEVNYLTAFTGGMPSPPTFDFSSLSGLGSPGLPGFSPGLGVGTGFPALLPGSSTHLPAGTATTVVPNPSVGLEHLLALEPEPELEPEPAAVVSPRLERHWRDVQDVDKDVAESESQIHHLIDTLGPIFQSTGLATQGLGGFSGLGTSMPMNHDGSMIMPTMNMKNINMLNASSSNSTTKVAGDGSGRDTDADISSLDPAHLSIPTGLENTDFDFDSFFPHNPSTPDSNSSFSTLSAHGDNNKSSPTIDTLTAKPGVIDSTMDLRFDMDDISGMGGISGYNLNDRTAFLNDVPSPAVPGSPVQSKSSSTSTTITNASPSPSGVGKKRKSDVMAMGELEGALLGTSGFTARDGSATQLQGSETAGGGGGGGAKAKRRKD